MKIQIKDLYPNPYRDMDNYPINREKVDALKASIKQTGFWDNIVARNKDGKIQIAYGHHRLTALREALPWETEVDIPIKDLSDSTMIQIMANENMEEYRTSPAIIDETVKVARQFLMDNPVVLNEVLLVNKTGKELGATVIARFLNWSVDRVSGSLVRLNLVSSGLLDRQSLNKLPTDTSARSFVKKVTEYKLPVEKQQQVVDEILRTGNFGIDQIEKKIVEAKFQERPKKEKEREENMVKYGQFVATITNTCEDLKTKLDDLTRVVDQLGFIPENNQNQKLVLSLNGLLSKVTYFLNSDNIKKLQQWEK